MNTSIYIITKPLQYINVTNIPDKNLKYLIIINNFNDANEFYELVKSHSNLWIDIKIFDSKYFALSWLIIMNKRLKVSNIFLDSDYGIVLHFFLFFLKDKLISVYEEGWGSYREIRTATNFISFLKNKINVFFKNENIIGGSRFTTHIYLYHISFYKKTFNNNSKILLDFNFKFTQHIDSFKEFKYIFAQKEMSYLKNKEVLLYLTSYTYDLSIEDYLFEYKNNYKILKPHPHIKDFKGITKFDEILNGVVPAEFIINSLLKIVEKLVIIHHGSTSLLYFLNNEKILEINIDKKTNKFYNSFTKYLKHSI